LTQSSPNAYSRPAAPPAAATHVRESPAFVRCHCGNGPFQGIRRNAMPFRARLDSLSDRGADFTITLFHDGRAIIHGTSDVTEARGLYARYAGM